MGNSAVISQLGGEGTIGVVDLAVAGLDAEDRAGHQLAGALEGW